jgi:signal peptidase I
VISRLARTLVIAVIWASLGLAVGAILAAGAPRVLGFTSLTVLSGSMEPAIETGDIVVGQPIRAERAEVGDVVSFREPGTQRLVTHRVRSIRIAGGSAHLTTKGDANNAPERWTISRRGKVSRALYRLPKLGYARSLLEGPLGRFGLIVIPAILLAALALVRIWRPGHHSQNHVPTVA